MQKAAIIYHQNFKKYDFGPGHPLRGSCAMDEAAFKLVKGNKKIQEKVELHFFEPGEAADQDILAVHTEEYIEFIRELNEKGGYITLDTPVRKGMYDVAGLFAGAGIMGGKLVLENEFAKSFVFTMMGHHAGADFGGGFCIINDIAVTIEYLRKYHGLKRIMTIDYAANAGHGTMGIFYDTPEVLCIDIHQDPLTLFPGWGFPEQVGIGVGKGYSINISLPPFSRDQHFLYALNEIVVPVVHEYKPELIIAVGLNGCHYTVAINQLMLTLKGLKETVRIMACLADQLCAERLVHIGGFSLDTMLLPLGFLATVAGALDVDVELSEPHRAPENIPDVTGEVEKAVNNVVKIQRKYWKNL